MLAGLTSNICTDTVRLPFLPPHDTYCLLGSTSAALLVPSLHRETVINTERRPVYITPIKHLWNSHGWGGKKKLVCGTEPKERTKQQRHGKRDPLNWCRMTQFTPGGRGENTGKALCLGHRRTHILNTVMEWNSKRLSHHQAPLFHHSYFSPPPPLFLIKIFQLTHGFQMCYSLTAAEQLVTLSCLPSALFSLMVSFGSWLLPLFSVSCLLSPYPFSSPSPSWESGYQLCFM